MLGHIHQYVSVVRSPRPSWNLCHTWAEGGEARRGRVTRSVPMTLLFRPWVGCFVWRHDRGKMWTTRCAGVHVLTSISSAPSRINMLYGFCPGRINERRPRVMFNLTREQAINLLNHIESEVPQQATKVLSWLGAICRSEQRMVLLQGGKT